MVQENTIGEADMPREMNYGNSLKEHSSWSTALPQPFAWCKVTKEVYPYGEHCGCCKNAFISGDLVLMIPVLRYGLYESLAFAHADCLRHGLESVPWSKDDVEMKKEKIRKKYWSQGSS